MLRVRDQNALARLPRSRCRPRSRCHLCHCPRLRRHHCSAAAAPQAAIVPPRCCYLLAAAIALATVPSNRCSVSCLDIRGRWCIVVGIPWCGGLAELLGEKRKMPGLPRPYSNAPWTRQRIGQSFRAVRKMPLGPDRDRLTNRRVFPFLFSLPTTPRALHTKESPRQYTSVRGYQGRIPSSGSRGQ